VGLSPLSIAPKNQKNDLLSAFQSFQIFSFFLPLPQFVWSKFIFPAVLRQLIEIAPQKFLLLRAGICENEKTGNDRSAKLLALR
jgi:hypothetical protein